MKILSTIIGKDAVNLIINSLNLSHLFCLLICVFIFFFSFCKVWHQCVFQWLNLLFVFVDLSEENRGLDFEIEYGLSGFYTKNNNLWWVLVFDCCGFRSSRFARLLGIQCAMAGKNLYMRFTCSTGDAMGMNMVSKGVQNVLDFLRNDFPDMDVIGISGNFCCLLDGISWFLL